MLPPRSGPLGRRAFFVARIFLFDFSVRWGLGSGRGPVGRSGLRPRPGRTPYPRSSRDRLSRLGPALPVAAQCAGRARSGRV